jgi:hypothetical protein
VSNTLAIDAVGARRASLAMLAAGAIYTLSPVHPGTVCPMLALTGYPCPLCGMTRSVAAAVRGDLVASLRFQPFGIALVALAIWLAVRRRPATLQIPAWTLPAALAGMWAWNLFLNPTFR